jgi:hypothetical protein
MGNPTRFGGDDKMQGRVPRTVRDGPRNKISSCGGSRFTVAASWAFNYPGLLKRPATVPRTRHSVLSRSTLAEGSSTTCPAKLKTGRQLARSHFCGCAIGRQAFQRCTSAALFCALPVAGRIRPPGFRSSLYQNSFQQVHLLTVAMRPPLVFARLEEILQHREPSRRTHQFTCCGGW